MKIKLTISLLFSLGAGVLASSSMVQDNDVQQNQELSASESIKNFVEVSYKKEDDHTI